MSLAMDDYLNRVLVYANLKPEEEAAAREELKDHLEEKVAQLVSQSVSREDAIFRAIKDMGSPQKLGYGLRPRFPWIDVRSTGTARGFIAIGPRAVGVFAFGGCAMGVFTFGGLSLGVFSVGGLSLGLLFCWAGVAVAPLGLANGGLAAGLIAFGGFALGVLASGGAAAGFWVPRAGAFLSYYPQGTSPSSLNWLHGLWDNPAVNGILSVFGTILFFTILLLGVVAQAREARRIRRVASVFAE